MGLALNGVGRLHRSGSVVEFFDVGRVTFVRTEHVNWSIYAGEDGTLLIDSGYAGQRQELGRSLQHVGVAGEDLAAVLITHAHADHIGGARWLSADLGIPVYTGATEVPHLRREYLQQVGFTDIARNALRHGVLPWVVTIAPLLRDETETKVTEAQALPMREDGRIALPGAPIAVPLPGHTSGHTGYYFAADNVLITGDAIVTGHRTLRTTGPQLLPAMFHHDPSHARRSLQSLPHLDDVTILPGHGEPWSGNLDDVAKRLIHP